MSQNKPTVIDSEVIITLISKGVYKALVTYFAVLFISAFIIFHVMDWFSDTDSPETRSGLEIKIDNLTGCQYLTSDRGGLTPRLHEDGSHLGCNPYR